jgi:hypothetical protein
MANGARGVSIRAARASLVRGAAPARIGCKYGAADGIYGVSVCECGVRILTLTA